MAAGSASSTPWFHVYQRNPDAALRLFGFPYAGGTARMFMSWADRVHPDVELLALQAPGREERFDEEPIGCVLTMAQRVCDEIEPFLDRPFLFVGHSNGTLVCFELARELRRRGLPGPKHMILSGTRAAHLRKPNIVYDLPDDELTAKLREWDATPEAIINNEKFLKIVFPMLRADFSIADVYRYRDGEPLSCDLTLFWARGETDVTREETLAWRDLVDGRTEYVEFDGGHMFIRDRADEYLRALNRVIESVLTTA